MFNNSNVTFILNQIRIHQFYFFIALTNHYLTIINHAMIKNLQKPFGVNPPGTISYQLPNHNRLTEVSMAFSSAKF
jgi:hypothetical protein